MRLDSMQFLVSLSLIIGFCLLASTSNYHPPRFIVKGVVKDEKGNDPVKMVVVNSTEKDSLPIELENGKFDLDLKFEKHYLLLLDRGPKNLKRILISTFRPISSQDYKVKMVLDVKTEEESSRYGLLEYNGFERKFVIKPLRQSELRRRKYEFSEFYSSMVVSSSN